MENNLSEMKGLPQMTKVFPCPPNIPRKNAVPEKKYSFEIAPDPIPANIIKTAITADVIVVGGGISGLSAALSAAEAGSKVVVIEKTKTCNGFGGGNAFIDSPLQKQHGVRIDKDELVLNLMKYGSNRPDQRLLRMWANESGQTADWLLKKCQSAKFKILYKPPVGPIEYNSACEYYPIYPVSHNIEGGEQELANHLMVKSQEIGVRFYFETRAMQLISNRKNRVTGVIAQGTKGDYIQFNAEKAVVLCTGDYGNNAEMADKYCPEVREMGTAHVTATGDGHQMAMWKGATMEPAPHAAMIHGFNGPLFSYPFLEVNCNGERFQNEDIPMELFVNAILRQPGQVVWQVFDSKYPDELKKMGSGLGRNYSADDLREFVEYNALKANTIDELAEKMSIHPEILKATITRYNDLAKSGKDLDFGKRPDRLTSISQPPYYAGRGGYWFIATLGGLNVNTKLQAIDKNGEAIPGLFLGGNIVGNRFGLEYPTMCPGLSNGMALFFGRVAGLNAAGVITG